MKAILTDTTRCIGCERCVERCREINKLEKDLPWRWRSPDGLSAARWTTVLVRPGGHYVRKHCMHCLDPACVSVCLVGALKKTPEGPVIYDSSICIGCRYCMNACPFGVPRYDWNHADPLIQKCNMCYPRIKEGKLPGCVEACPTHATIFGDRDELIAEARRRIKAEPDRYIHKIWGENTVGGTSVLFISDIDLSFLGWKKDLGTRPLPKLTWAVLTKMPPIFFGLGAVLAGVYWVYERKNKLMAENNESERRERGGKDDDDRAS